MKQGYYMSYNKIFVYVGLNVIHGKSCLRFCCEPKSWGRARDIYGGVAHALENACCDN